MNWFGYVWIIVLVLAYVIWTIKCIKDFISDVRGAWKLSTVFKAGASWGYWIVIHAIILIASSLAYFLLMIGGAK